MSATMPSTLSHWDTDAPVIPPRGARLLPWILGRQVALVEVTLCDLWGLITKGPIHLSKEESFEVHQCYFGSFVSC